MYEHLALVALFIFFYSLVAGRLERTPISGPIVYVLFGLLLSAPFLGLPPRTVSAHMLRGLAELTLALVLFTDAANADLTVLRSSSKLPRRLLLIGLPLTILLGFLGAAAIFPDLTLLEAAVLATMLAPTDAALGQPVVENKAVPADIRDGLNVESGLNDGICVPFLFIFLVLSVDTTGHIAPLGLALRLVLEEIGIGAVTGAAVTLLGVLAVNICQKRGWGSDEWSQLTGMALALTCFAMAQWLGGSGFIASFTGGLLFGYLARPHKKQMLSAAVDAGDIFGIVTWVAFGYAVVSIALNGFEWRYLIYAVLSLTLFRMLPVWLSLRHMGLSRGSKLFIGWFGPRGLASIVFAIIVLEEKLPGGRTILMTTVCTIILSVFAHGFTAEPLASIFGARRNAAPVKES